MRVYSPAANEYVDWSWTDLQAFACEEAELASEAMAAGDYCAAAVLYATASITSHFAIEAFDKAALDRAIREAEQSELFTSKAEAEPNAIITLASKGLAKGKDALTDNEFKSVCASVLNAAKGR